jgi:hypothetical protein
VASKRDGPLFDEGARRHDSFPARHERLGERASILSAANGVANDPLAPFPTADRGRLPSWVVESAAASLSSTLRPSLQGGERQGRPIAEFRLSSQYCLKAAVRSVRSIPGQKGSGRSPSLERGRWSGAGTDHGYGSDFNLHIRDRELHDQGRIGRKDAIEDLAQYRADRLKDLGRCDIGRDLHDILQARPGAVQCGLDVLDHLSQLNHRVSVAISRCVVDADCAGNIDGLSDLYCPTEQISEAENLLPEIQKGPISLEGIRQCRTWMRQMRRDNMGHWLHAACPLVQGWKCWPNNSY